MTKVKICGLKRPEDIAMANRLRPDYIGMVFYRKSRRAVDEKTAAALRARLDPAIPAVGVFVNEEISAIERLCEGGVIQLVQLHGDEDAAYLARLKERIPAVPLIKAQRVRSAEDILFAERTACDFLLLDTYVKDVYGGSGRGFDKALIPPLAKPFFLAGGLTPENVRENILACQACHPYGVDVSSAVETDGVKDEDKMRRFLERVRKDEF